MNKFFISSTLTAMTFLATSAQNPVVNNPDNQAYFGIRLGGEITCPGSISYDGVGVNAFKNGGGVEVAGIFNIPVVANFYIEPGLKFFYNTYSVKKDFLDFVDDNVSVSNISFRKFGIRIPVMAGYHFDFSENTKLYLFTGPELEIGLSAKGYITANNIEVSENEYGDDGGINRASLLWSIGAGLTYQHLYFGIGTSLGLTNLLKDSDATFHENRATLSIGYNF